MGRAPWLLALGISLLAPWIRGADDPPSPNTPAPVLELTAVDGKAMSLADFRGRVVLVDIWASWCAPCKTSFSTLDALYAELHPKGLEVLAVNVDERRRDADEFLSHHPHKMTVLLDPKGRVPEALGADAMPSSFLIDRRGNVRFRHTGIPSAIFETYRGEIAALLEEAPDDEVVVMGGN